VLEDAGGHSYDLILANYFAEEIEKKENNPQMIKSNAKTMFKLIKEC